MHINKKCVGREGHLRKVTIGKFEIALREFYEKTCTTYTLMCLTFTVAAVEVFLMLGYADLS